MGYLPPPDPALIGTEYGPSSSAPRLNVDRHGNPRDYATYMWLLYRKRVVDRSPERMAFLYGPSDGSLRTIAERTQAIIFHGDFGSQEIMR